MKSSEKYKRCMAEARIDISPLIDMVFILLVFFVVTTIFVEETGLEAATASSGEVDARPEALELVIDSRRMVTVNG
ncbi:biopolymer transporter ExbD [Pelagicoccus sp. SDUM812003]|uniref:ExbD/TolR family protein n=1 Tax=Pelagicoccus sp. SDUM812003 TaxID=3041267 RepID=UPI00280D4025|nr:biopolymer transporter ExbD [Pelagicoccus sp. SDUM812003]MDQ8203075.1 biopolymer transporter ExbD [Pelagicoccus sp. SDUM812003]